MVHEAGRSTAIEILFSKEGTMTHTRSKSPEKIPVRNLVLAGLFVAIGILIPQAFHLLALGKHFLPMHIPVILGGMLLGWQWGFLIGCITPMGSSLLTGMPPLMPPVAVSMTVELAVIGSLAGVSRSLCGRSIIAALVLTLIAGRLAWGVAGYFLLPLLGFKGVSLVYPLTVGLISSLPGIAVQLLIIPPLVKIIERNEVQGHHEQP